MTLVEAKSHSDEFCKAFNARNLSSVLAFYSPSLAGHGGGGQFGIDDLRKWFPATWASFPDVRIGHEVIAAAGDSYTARWSLSGTHNGMYVGKAPTGKHFEAWGLFVHRMQDGKIMEVWTAFDDLGLREQLGLIPKLG